MEAFRWFTEILGRNNIEFSPQFRTAPKNGAARRSIGYSCRREPLRRRDAAKCTVAPRQCFRADMAVETAQARQNLPQLKFIPSWTSLMDVARMAAAVRGSEDGGRGGHNGRHGGHVGGRGDRVVRRGGDAARIGGRGEISWPRSKLVSAYWTTGMNVPIGFGVATYEPTSSNCVDYQVRERFRIHAGNETHTDTSQHLREREDYELIFKNNIKTCKTAAADQQLAFAGMEAHELAVGRPTQ
ncbi:hypothetical protein C8R44DRAFT_725291 [Mycena epipterygia]|nr:hypothetical protein C8R44DRAFT_725291 [Mycena epipterygia]